MKKTFNNTEFKELFEKSGLNKRQFGIAIAMKPQAVGKYLDNENEMSNSTFDQYKRNYEIHINNTNQK